MLNLNIRIIFISFIILSTSFADNIAQEPKDTTLQDYTRGGSNRSSQFDEQFVSMYIAFGIDTAVDTTYYPPDFSHMINPLTMFEAYGGKASIGLEPFSSTAILRALRLEATYMYHKSRYEALVDENAGQLGQNSKNGAIFLKNAIMLNGYFDLKYLDPYLFPYFGYGVGTGTLQFKSVDVTIQPIGIAEGWHGKGIVPIMNLMAGMKYYLPFLRASFAIEYSFLATGKIDVESRNLQDTINNPSGPDIILHDKVGHQIHTLSFIVSRYLN